MITTPTNEVYVHHMYLCVCVVVVLLQDSNYSKKITHGELWVPPGALQPLNTIIFCLSTLSLSLISHSDFQMYCCEHFTHTLSIYPNRNNVPPTFVLFIFNARGCGYLRTDLYSTVAFIANNPQYCKSVLQLYLSVSLKHCC